MNKAGWTEYVHIPSLVQHAGNDSSTLGNINKMATDFPGEDYDAQSFLKRPAGADQQEVDRLKKALAEDEARLLGETNPRSRERLLRWVATYKEKLLRLGA